MKIRDVHTWSLQTSTRLSKYYMPKAPTPRQVISVLNRERISFVLVGLHGIGGWMNDPRATEDVDLVVAARHVKRASRALLEEFPGLDLRDQPVVARLFDPRADRVVIDLIKGIQPLFRAVFKNAKIVKTKEQTYRIPSLEMALTMKFAAMTGVTRSHEDKHQDAHDFIMMVKTNSDIDLDKLAELGELVYPQGGGEIVDTIRKIRNGEQLEV